MYLMAGHPNGTFLVVNTKKGLIDKQLTLYQAFGILAVFKSDYYDHLISYDEALEVLWNHYPRSEYKRILKNLGEKE